MTYQKSDRRNDAAKPAAGSGQGRTRILRVRSTVLFVSQCCCWCGKRGFLSVAKARACGSAVADLPGFSSEIHGQPRRWRPAPGPGPPTDGVKRAPTTWLDLLGWVVEMSGHRERRAAARAAMPATRRQPLLLALLLGSAAAQNAPIKTLLGGKCGPGTVTISGIEAECDPDSAIPCCGKSGFCGGSAGNCDCEECTRFVASSTGTRTVRGAQTLQCNTKAADLVGIHGSVLKVFCPANCADTQSPIWGTDIYTDDSPVCLAGVHAGVLPKRSAGVLRVVVVKKLVHHFTGTTRNGVATRDWVGTWHRNFRVLRLFEGTAMLGPGMCSVSFSGSCPTGYESSQFVFDTEDVDNADLMGPEAALVPLSLRNCSHLDGGDEQLECTEAHARFPRLVFCCDTGMNSTSQRTYASGSTGLIASDGIARTSPLATAGFGAVSKTLTCPEGYDRSWFRFDTEDSFNQDVVVGDTPEGLSDGMYPTLVMCKPSSVVTCDTTFGEFWTQRGSPALSTGHTWVPAKSAVCKDGAGQTVVADEYSCERDFNTGHQWSPAVAGRCHDSSNNDQAFDGQQACETEPSGYEWDDNDNAVCAAVSDTNLCVAAGNCRIDVGVCTHNVAATCICTGLQCAAAAVTPPTATTQTACERVPSAYTWVPPVNAVCRDSVGAVVAGSTTEETCLRPLTGNVRERATPAECRNANEEFVTAIDQGFCEDSRASLMALCPSGCAAANNVRIFGTDRYAMDAPVCATAVHGNSLDDTNGGRVYITKYDANAEGLRDLQGSAQNGLHSFTWSGSTPTPRTFFSASKFIPRNEAAFVNDEPTPPIVLGYLGLPVPANYRPDWSRLSHIAFTGLAIQNDGTVSGTGNGIPTSAATATATWIDEAGRNGIKSMLAVRCYSAFTLKAALSQGADESTQAARLLVAQNIVASLGNMTGALGIQLDIQDFHAAEALSYMALVATVRDLLKAQNMGLLLSVTLPPNEVEAAKFDITALSRYVDFFVLTGYSLAGRNVFQQPVAVPPSPLSSLAQPGGLSLNATVQMYLAMPAMARERLVLGLPWFGFEWHVDGPLVTNLTGAPTAAVDREDGTPSLISIHEARRRQTLFNATYDEVAAAWWYYVPKKTSSGDTIANSSKAVFGWLEDDRSFAAKAAFALSTQQLGGVAIGALGMEWVDQPLLGGDEELREMLFSTDASVVWAVRDTRARIFLGGILGSRFADSSCCPSYAAAAELSRAASKDTCASRCPQESSRGCCYWNEDGSSCRVSSDVALLDTPVCTAGNFSFVFDQCDGVSCGQHGTCDRGVCTCDSGYSGDECQTSGWLTDEAVWDALGGLAGSPAQASRELVECDTCLLAFNGQCPDGHDYSWYRFNTEVNFNADDGVGTLPLGFVEEPHNPRITMQTIAFFPRLELCCRIC